MIEKFQIVIPLTGEGARFVNAGFIDLKPFIEVHGKPMIEWIVTRMLSVNEDILFVCRDEHLKQNSRMEELLLTIAPNAKILTIDAWKKKGPVYDILKVSDQLDNSKPTVVSYCDYFMSWNWAQFKEKVIANNCDGAIPTYTGFHPHLIPRKNVYASCLIDENENLIEIKEKFSFEEDKLLVF